MDSAEPRVEWSARVWAGRTAIDHTSPAHGLLYYYEELTLHESVLGVTESRVSQLHTKAILRMKAHLSGASREPAET